MSAGWLTAISSSGRPIELEKPHILALATKAGFFQLKSKLPLTLFGMTYVIYDIGFNKGIFLKKTLTRKNLN
jgi:hypothetical protein